MDEKFVLLTDDCSNYTNVQAKEIERVRGGLKPSCSKIKWYTPPSAFPEYYSKWQEYDRMDLTDGKPNNDEVLDDGKYNPGTRYVMYSSLKDTTIRIRPSKFKEVLARVNASVKYQNIPDDIVRTLVAREIGNSLENHNIKHVICEIDDLSDVIVLEDIFAASDYIDPVEHDILKNEIKLYIFDPHAIYHASEDKKFKAYSDIKARVEKGFYKKKIEFLDMLRWDKTMEPKSRDSYLRCGVFPKDGETPEQCYDRVKPYLEQLYRDFERYKDNYEEFKIQIFKRLPRAVSPERNEWDERYNDEAITEALVQGYVRFFSGLYISSDAEKNICIDADKRRRFRYNRSFQVTSLAIFDSNALELEKVIDVEEIRLKNIEVKKREQENVR
ncbi:MAG: hypothetical protein ACI4ON_01485 [Clostridia bacterium]